ncbi:MAG TPA: AAA family ATPase [Firmicutes bacterium]|nr:AAA family ATPase [Bacillota bacterium]
MKDRLTFELPDGSIIHFPGGTTFQQIAAELQPRYLSPIIAIKLNNEIRELYYTPQVSGKLAPIDLGQEDGVRIYFRSLSLVMVRAAEELFPGCKIRFEHSLSKGIYGEIHLPEQQPCTEKELRQIANRMRVIIKADEPITRATLPLDKALELFKERHQLDKVRLLAFKSKPEVHIYQCGGYVDYFYGYMAPSTGCLEQFDLKYYYPGFIMRFPTQSSPKEIPRFQEQRKLARIFYEFEKWGEIMGIEDVGALNQQIAAGRSGELIRIAEALHEKKIAQIADQIAVDRDRIKLVLIAGPSSSGKTTFAQRLAVQLKVNGLKPVPISIDDYFVDRELTPLGADGLPDYECLEALNVELFNEHLSSLIQGLPVVLPRYNFQKGKSESSNVTLEITKEQPLIIEGIHGLNDKLTAGIPKDNKFTIYISALTQLNIDDHNRIPTTDNRVIRRIVRDNQFRGHDALKTIGMWPMVRRGEEAHIFPFQEEADVMFNSALVYELAVLKHCAEPLLQQITPEYPEFSEAKRLLKFLGYFLPMEDQDVPLNSIIREFIGSSCFCV